MGLPILSGVFGINGSEFLVIILVAVIVVGPQRLPEYTRKLTQMVRQLRVFLDNARSQIAEEVGPEMADLDLSSLDPRQYDPRKIVRDALGEDIDAIREDLAHPFRSVGSAAKEMSDDAAQAVNDVVKKDRATSLSKQIEAKRDERLAEKDTEKAENTESTLRALSVLGALRVLSSPPPLRRGECSSRPTTSSMPSTPRPRLMLGRSSRLKGLSRRRQSPSSPGRPRSPRTRRALSSRSSPTVRPSRWRSRQAWSSRRPLPPVRMQGTPPRRVMTPVIACALYRRVTSCEPPTPPPAPAPRPRVSPSTSDPSRAGGTGIRPG